MRGSTKICRGEKIRWRIAVAIIPFRSSSWLEPINHGPPKALENVCGASKVWVSRAPSSLRPQTLFFRVPLTDPPCVGGPTPTQCSGACRKRRLGSDRGVTSPFCALALFFLPFPVADTPRHATPKLGTLFRVIVFERHILIFKEKTAAYCPNLKMKGTMLGGTLHQSKCLINPLTAARSCYIYDLSLK